MRSSLSRECGFTYVGLLVTVVVMGLMLTVVSRVWRTTEQRERETQLLFVGHAYRLAIASYFASGHQYPATLQDLLQDERFPVPKRHLRRLYPDPLTGQADWSLVLTPTGQGIMGVASSSHTAPIKRDGFELIDEAFKDADCYCAWQFIYYANRWTHGIAAPQPGGAPIPFQPGTPPTITPGTGGPPGTVNPYLNPSISPVPPRPN